MEYNIFSGSAPSVNTSVEWSGDELFLFLYFRCSHKDFKPKRVMDGIKNRWSITSLLDVNYIKLQNGKRNVQKLLYGGMRCSYTFYFLKKIVNVGVMRGKQCTQLTVG